MRWTIQYNDIDDKIDDNDGDDENDCMNYVRKY